MKNYAESSAKHSVFFLLIVLIFTNIPIVQAPAPDFGENNTALGQVVDEFANSDFLNVTIDVIRNATLQAVELNYTGVAAGYVLEDYTTYTETDIAANRVIIHNATRLEVEKIDLDEEVRVWKDLGSENKWVNFTGRVDVLMQAWISNGECAPFCIAQELDDYHTAHIQEGITIRVRHNTLPAAWSFHLSKHEAGVLTTSTYVSANDNANTWFYMDFNRTGANVYWDIYSDAARTSKLTTLTVTLTNATIDYQYIYAMNARNRPLGGRALEVEFYNLQFYQPSSTGYELDGYMTTNDLMASASGGTLSNLLNVTMPTNTNMTVEYSLDNMTWVDNENNTGFYQCVDGLQTVELRFLNFTVLYQRFNFSTTDDSVTSRLFQNRIVTTYAAASVGAAARPEGWVLTIMIAVLGLALIILATRRRR